MRIVFPPVGVVAGVNGQGVRQPFVRRELLGECVSECDLVLRFEITRQREVRAQIQATVRPLEQVGCIPVIACVVLCPSGHVIGLRVDRGIALRLVVLVRPRDVRVRSAGARTAAARS